MYIISIILTALSLVWFFVDSCDTDKSIFRCIISVLSIFAFLYLVT